MRRQLLMGLMVLAPGFALAQTAPSADQNYCANTGAVNAPFRAYVQGLCNASQSMLVALYSYTTHASDGSMMSRGENALMAAFSPKTVMPSAPAMQAPETNSAAPAAPETATAPAKKVNPYDYS